MAKPNWIINDVAPLRHCKDKILTCGLIDVANNHDDTLWFSDKDNLEYICKALNFYETYAPLLEDLEENLEFILKSLKETKEDNND